MTWSYSFNPKSSAKDTIRFLVGDTVEKQPFLHDEEIASVLEDHNGDLEQAAIGCCEAILSQLARSRDESVGSVSISFSQRVASYEKMLARLQRRYSLSGGYTAYAGGISRADKDNVSQNDDRVRPDFEKSQINQGPLQQWYGPPSDVWRYF